MRVGEFMPRLTNSLLLLLCLSLTATACSKKGKVRAAAPPPTSGAPSEPLPPEEPPEENGEYLPPNDYPYEGGEPVAPVGRVEEDEYYEEEDSYAGNDRSCGAAKQRNSQDWFPGLPYEPSQTVICTGHKKGNVSDAEMSVCDPGRGYLYTDSRQDDLMSRAVKLSNRLPDRIQAASRQFARAIGNIKLHVDLKNSKRVKLLVAVERRDGEYDQFVLQGRLGERLNRISVNGRKFSGVVVCGDRRACQNALIRIEELGSGNRVKRAAYVVHRWGDAHVTISDKDLKRFHSIENENHAALAELLSNTAVNTCLAVLEDVRSGARPMPRCAVERLQSICGGKRPRSPSAEAFDFRSWAVAYGRSGFDFALLDQGAPYGLYDFTDQQAQVLSIGGALVISNKRPMLDKPLLVDGFFADRIKNVWLMTNDGGGNLNLQVEFAGKPQSQTRVSLTTLIADSEFRGDMPSLSERDIDDGRLPEPPAEPTAPPEEEYDPAADLG